MARNPPPPLVTTDLCPWAQTGEVVAIKKIRLGQAKEVRRLQRCF